MKVGDMIEFRWDDGVDIILITKVDRLVDEYAFADRDGYTVSGASIERDTQENRFGKVIKNIWE